MSENFSIDQKAIHLLAKILNESALSEIEYQQGDARIRLSRGKGSDKQETLVPPLVIPSNLVPLPDLSPESSSEKVSAPLVGTAYLSPEPGAKPFVNVNDSVQQGQVLLIIEAMKVMNPIRAPRAGVVHQICVEDGSPVEFGEALFYLS